ncbi:MAG TPA: protein-glutamate O-methyltransferase CheR [Longimicrobiaceae bacterium]|nr:protein-glutamate O-methyltransferase CheR [Longimicrobiaceae bacterium]
MISPADYQFISDVLLRNSGLNLGPGKEYLLESRLMPVATVLGLHGLDGLVQRLRTHGDASTIRSVCEAMTTNESLFFRDSTPFRMIQETLLAELMEKRRATRRLRIWCSAASTGQEPYSVAMILRERAPLLQGWSVEILATDYSRPAIDRARAGRYNHFEVQRGLPIQMLTRYFRRTGEDWQVVDEIRSAVCFRELNLIEPFGHLGQFDLILCRNVLIYFDMATKAQVLECIAQAMAPDGYLFLGGSETAMGITSRLERVANAPTSLYRLSPTRAALGLAS